MALAMKNDLMQENVAVKYRSYLILAAKTNVFGTLQTAVIATITERRTSSWKIRWRGLKLFTILYGVNIATLELDSSIILHIKT